MSLYTCPAADVGSTVELSFDGQSLFGNVNAAHDPPISGMEHVRFKRTESYVKEFRPLDMGEIELMKGTGTLKLRALKIPGSQVMEFRLMLLTRLLDRSQ